MTYLRGLGDVPGGHGASKALDALPIGVISFSSSMRQELGFVSSIQVRIL